MKQNRNRQRPWIFFLLSLFLAFTAAGGLALAAAQIAHTPPEGTYIPGFRIQLEATIQNGDDLLAARCYFKTKQDQNFAFVEMFNKGGGKYQAVLPAPWVNSEAVEYLFLTVDKNKAVTRSPLYTIEEGQTPEATAWKDAGQVKEVRLDTMQEKIEDCEVVRRQLLKNHGKKLPKYQTAKSGNTLAVQTEINKDLVPLNGFYDKAEISQVTKGAQYGLDVDGLYESGSIFAGHSTAFWVGTGAVVAGGTALALSGGGGGGGSSKPSPTPTPTPTPTQLNSTTILGDWKVTGSRPDGYTMSGDFTFQDNGTFLYNTVSYTPSGVQSTQVGDGSWTLNGTYLEIVTNVANGAGFSGTAYGDSKAFNMYSPDNDFTLYLTR